MYYKRKVQKDILLVNTNDDPYIHFKLEPKNDDSTELIGEMSGPLDTPYEGGIFILDIKLPSNYPYLPPIVKFVTKVWHPNVSPATGYIYLDTLENKWAACLSLRIIMLSIHSLLGNPQFDTPEDAVVDKQDMDIPEMYKQTARHWTNVYAGGSNKEPELEQKIEEMKAMGYEENKARIALSNTDWVIDDAIDLLN